MFLHLICTTLFWLWQSCEGHYVPHRSHPVLTYFHQVDQYGKLVDRLGSEYARNIQLPILSRILPTDLDAAVDVSPNIAENGNQVHVSWSGVNNSSQHDWIGFFCPENDDAHHYLDYIKVSTSSTWQKGYGSVNVRVYNMRTTCQFRYYRNDKYSQLVAISNRLSFAHGPEQPAYGHISVTGDPTEMNIMWTSGYVDRPIVKYGLQEKVLDMEMEAYSQTYKATDMCGPPATTSGFSDPGYMQRATLKKLKVNTEYFYSFGSKNVMSPVFSFKTSLPAGDHTPYKFIIYGDMGVSAFPGGHETATLMLKEVKKNGVRLILHDGDISYARGMAYIWDQWFTLIEPFSPLVPYMVSIGNHEQDHTTGGSKDPSGAPGEGFHPTWGNYGDDSSGECGVPMFYRFQMPDNGNSLWWYSFDYGMVHFVIMSTEHDFRKGSRQYAWLESDLDSVDRKQTPWIILLGHRPMYCSGYYPGDYQVTVFMRKYFEILLYKYKVDLALWGHYHSYERTCKVYREECGDQGTIHLIIGSAGASLDSGKYYKKNWSVYRDDAFGYGRFTAMNASALYFEFVQNRDQVVKDSLWITK